MEIRDNISKRGLDLTHQVIGACIEVHRLLGPGLLESTYEACVCEELRLLGLFVERQKAMSICYKGVKLDQGYRLDLVVENRLILELKAVESILPIHEAQILTYLRLSGLHVGLLLNFNVPALKNGGIRRFVHELPN